MSYKAEPMRFAQLAPAGQGRCGVCMEPYSRHRPRMSAAPLCPTGKGVYREATEEELSAAYNEAFPEGPKPIATFNLNNPDDVERAKASLSPEALNRFFGPGGEGMAAFERSLRGEPAP